MDSVYRYSPFIALTGAIICLAQGIIVLIHGNPLCLNQGCQIVEQLTTIPQLYFYAAGLMYFIVLFLCMKWAKPTGSLRTLTTALLLAGIAAEGVLVNFQYFIAQSFCSSCLVIFLFILLLNLLEGFKGSLRALSIFGAITMAFVSLDFSPSTTAEQTLENGSIAVRPVSPSTPQAYLFFSSTCAHCENVIEYLKDNSELNLAFNPIDEVQNFTFPGSESRDSYRSDINRRFLTTLGIAEIPVVLLVKDGGMEIMRGEKSIIEELESLSGPAINDYTGTSTIEQIPGLESADDGCAIDTDCENGAGLIPPAARPAP